MAVIYETMLSDKYLQRMRTVPGSGRDVNKLTSSNRLDSKQYRSFEWIKSISKSIIDRNVNIDLYRLYL